MRIPSPSQVALLAGYYIFGVLGLLSDVVSMLSWRMALRCRLRYLGVSRTEFTNMLRGAIATKMTASEFNDVLNARKHVDKEAARAKKELNP